MLHVRVWLLLLTTAGTVLLTTGCGQQQPVSVPVKGILTVDGKPLANANVQFHAQDPGGQDAYGTTNAEGRFELASGRRHAAGALPGRYKITVTYSAPVEAAADLKTAADVQKAGVSRKPGLVLPEIYTQPNQTVLKHTVPDDGDVKLELKSKSGS